MPKIRALQGHPNRSSSNMNVAKLSSLPFIATSLVAQHSLPIYVLTPMSKSPSPLPTWQPTNDVAAFCNLLRISNSASSSSCIAYCHSARKQWQMPGAMSAAL